MGQRAVPGWCGLHVSPLRFFSSSSSPFPLCTSASSPLKGGNNNSTGSYGCPVGQVNICKERKTRPPNRCVKQSACDSSLNTSSLPHATPAMPHPTTSSHTFSWNPALTLLGTDSEASRVRPQRCLNFSGASGNQSSFEGPKGKFREAKLLNSY